MIGSKLKELRAQNKYTIAQLCELTGLNQNTYAKYERNERDVSTETLSKLADFYGVTTDYLLGREPPPNPFADLNLTPECEKDVLAKYMSLPPEIRACALDVLRKLGAAVDGDNSEAEPPKPAEPVSGNIAEDMVNTIIKGERAFRKANIRKK